MSRNVPFLEAFSSYLGKIYSSLFLEFDPWVAFWLRDDPFCMSLLFLRKANMYGLLIISSESQS